MSLAAVIDQATVGRVAAAAVGPTGVVDHAGPVEERFDLASITKLFVTCAVLVAVEDGSLELDQPAGPAGSTLRHLLSHASGLDPVTDQALAPPGTRRIYSNAGFEAVGRVLESSTGLTLDVYVREAVLDPLGMADTAMGESAATGAVGTVADLALFAADLMAPMPTVLAPTTRDLAVSVAFPGLPGVLPGFGSQDPNDWGLGFELKGSKDPHWTPDGASPATFGHFGRSGSMLWVDPEVPVGLVSLSDQPFGDWAPPFWRRLGDDVLSARGADEKRASRQDGAGRADEENAVVDSGVTR
jgi:CubicO group peptidase (beta-lactamase class C family)